MIHGLAPYEGQYSDLRTRVVITFTGWMPAKRGGRDA